MAVVRVAVARWIGGGRHGSDEGVSGGSKGSGNPTKTSQFA